MADDDFSPQLMTYLEGHGDDYEPPPGWTRRLGADGISEFVDSSGLVINVPPSQFLPMREELEDLYQIAFSNDITLSWDEASSQSPVTRASNYNATLVEARIATAQEELKSAATKLGSLSDVFSDDREKRLTECRKLAAKAAGVRG